MTGELRYPPNRVKLRGAVDEALDRLVYALDVDNIEVSKTELVNLILWRHLWLHAVIHDLDLSDRIREVAHLDPTYLSVKACQALWDPHYE